MSETRFTDVDQLLELTKGWSTYEDIPRSQQRECFEIGKRIFDVGGTAAMRDAYYVVKGRNPAAGAVAAYWHGIGDWQW